MRFLFTFIIFILTSISISSKSNIIKIKYINTPKPMSVGIDISFYQGSISWEKLDTNVSFVICKATEGITIVDSKYKENWNKINRTKGSYHFFRPEVSGIKQANFYLENTYLHRGDIKPIIDIEYTHNWKYRKYTKMYINNFLSMVSEVRRKTGHDPIIYTSALFWNNYISPYYKNTHLLWIVDYHHDDPIIPTSFDDWTIWQWSCHGLVNGIPTYVDLNYCKNIDTLIIK
jgi:lysozyme